MAKEAIWPKSKHNTLIGAAKLGRHRSNPASQVIDINGEVFRGLYCAGESAGGFS